MSTQIPESPECATQVAPLARRIPQETALHGERRVDDYAWLRDRSNPEVLAHLKAENEYTAAMLKPTEPLQQALYDEMLARIKQTDLTVPYREGGYFYYSRTEEGRQYPIYCRKPGSLDAPEEVVLDVNELARGEPYMAVGEFAVSDDGCWLAYSTDNTGFRDFTLCFKDLRTGRLLDERVARVTSAAWAADNATLFYTIEDHAKRSYRLYRRRLGAAREELLYEEKDERFRVLVLRTRSRACLLLSIASHTASEYRFLPASEPEGEWRLISPREPEHLYEVDHCEELFYIRTNSAGRNFRLVAAPVAAPERANWKEIVPHRTEVMLEGVLLFARHMVLVEREQGLRQFAVRELDSGRARRVAFPEPAYAAWPEENRDFAAAAFRYKYQSLVTPPAVFDYDFEAQESRLLKQTEVLGSFDSGNYQSERIYASAADGTRIPVSLVYRKGLQRDGRAPLVLAGYGAYGHSYEAAFSSSRVSLLDRGVVFAIAHVRGGGELGKPWHDSGRMMNKRNTFSDFMAAAEHLFTARYTSPDRLALYGGSAGGLLLGAVLNARPDLCKAAVLLVPFVDIINTMLDESLPLTVAEFEEWGNPKIKEEYEYLRSYCPYSNLRRGNYPALLVRTSFYDSQVMYWEPAKYVARLRALNANGNPALLHVNLAAGHGGASGRYDVLREAALDYAFLLTQLGIST